MKVVNHVFATYDCQEHFVDLLIDSRLSFSSSTSITECYKQYSFFFFGCLHNSESAKCITEVQSSTEERCFHTDCQLFSQQLHSDSIKEIRACNSTACAFWFTVVVVRRAIYLDKVQVVKSFPLNKRTKCAFANKQMRILKSYQIRTKKEIKNVCLYVCLSLGPYNYGTD